MTVSALQSRVKKNISLIEDKSVLIKINQLIDETSKVYVLSDYHLKRVDESRKQIEEGNFFTQDEMDKKVEAWLNEK